MPSSEPREPRAPDPSRSAARYHVDRWVEEDAATGGVPPDPDGSSGAETRRLSQVDGRGRMDRRGEWVDELVRQAIARGEFDDLPLAGKPIPGIDGHHDPDWWLKNLVERERITGVLPEALQLRTDDAALDDRLDRMRGAEQVRGAVEEFNARIVQARRQLLGGPPVITPLRDVEAEVRRWAERAAGRRAAQDAAAARERA
ncbi:DUF1992 domain-containing protein, partial [Actinotalea ferrariae]|uniref:DnaJ family domain-containing protein n=1 Tax=Actinotalea ferrariae TaxID=1386098 RepID=UPI001C8BCF2F